MRNQFKRLLSEKNYLFRMLCNDFTDKVIVNTAVMITLVSFLFMISGCSYYRSVTRVKEGSVDLLTETVNKFYPEFNFPRDQYPIADLYNLFFKEYNLYLIDSKGKWELSDIDIRNDTVYATAVLSSVLGDTLTDLPGDKTSVRYKQNKEIELLESLEACLRLHL